MSRAKNKNKKTVKVEILKDYSRLSKGQVIEVTEELADIFINKQKIAKKAEETKK